MMICLDGSDFGVDLGDHVDELFEVDGAVSVLVGEVDDLVDFCAGEVLAHAGSHLLELLRAESSAASGVEGLEDGLESGLAVVISSESEDFQEGSEIDVAGVSGVVDDGEDLSSLGLEVEGANGVDEFVSGDVAAAIVVEHVEHFLQLPHCLGIKALLHVLAGVKAFRRGRSRSRRSRL